MLGSFLLPLFKHRFQHTNNCLLERMGQSQPHYQALLSHSPDNWFTISSHHCYEVLKNKSTHQLVQEYIVPIESKDALMKQLQIYEYRRLQSDNLVSVLEIEKLENKNLCGNMLALKVITERIPHRLSDVTQLTLPEALYVVKESLLGFRTIYQYDGPLIIDEEMIGFNSNGKVKVWLNSNFGSNQRSFVNRRFLNKGTLQNHYQNQMNMIHTIFNLVMGKLKGGIEPRMKQKMVQINGFFNALNCVDDFCEEIGITLPSHVSEMAFSVPEQEKKQKTRGQSDPAGKLSTGNNVSELQRNRISQVNLQRSGSISRIVNPYIKYSGGTSREKTKESSSSSSTSFYRQNKALLSNYASTSKLLHEGSYGMCVVRNTPSKPPLLPKSSR